MAALVSPGSLLPQEIDLLEAQALRLRYVQGHEDEGHHGDPGDDQERGAGADPPNDREEHLRNDQVGDPVDGGRHAAAHAAVGLGVDLRVHGPWHRPHARRKEGDVHSEPSDREPSQRALAGTAEQAPTEAG